MARYPDVRYIQYYTDGSAARELQMPAPRKQKSKLPPVRRKKAYVLHVDPLALGAIVMSVVMVVLMVMGCVQLYNLQADNARMEGYIADLSTEHAELLHMYESGYELESVKEAALALGMIPAEEATTITIRVEQPVQQSEDAWENFYAILAGIFA